MTLNHLLDLPLVQQVLPALPARVAEVKFKPEPIPQVSAAKPKEEARLVTSTDSTPTRILTKPSQVEGSNDATSNVRHQLVPGDSNRSAIPKLSEAALARRRKREQDRQTDRMIVPMF